MSQQDAATMHPTSTSTLSPATTLLPASTPGPQLAPNAVRLLLDLHHSLPEVAEQLASQLPRDVLRALYPTCRAARNMLRQAVTSLTIPASSAAVQPSRELMGEADPTFPQAAVLILKATPNRHKRFEDQRAAFQRLPITCPRLLSNLRVLRLHDWGGCLCNESAIASLRKVVAGCSSLEQLEILPSGDDSDFDMCIGLQLPSEPAQRLAILPNLLPTRLTGFPGRIDVALLTHPPFASCVTRLVTCQNLARLNSVLRALPLAANLRQLHCTASIYHAGEDDVTRYRYNVLEEYGQGSATFRKLADALEKAHLPHLTSLKLFPGDGLFMNPGNRISRDFVRMLTPHTQLQELVLWGNHLPSTLQLPNLTRLVFGHEYFFSQKPEHMAGLSSLTSLQEVKLLDIYPIGAESGGVWRGVCAVLKMLQHLPKLRHLYMLAWDCTEVGEFDDEKNEEEVDEQKKKLLTELPPGSLAFPALQSLALVPKADGYFARCCEEMEPLKLSSKDSDSDSESSESDDDYSSDEDDDDEEAGGDEGELDHNGRGNRSEGHNRDSDRCKRKGRDRFTPPVCVLQVTPPLVTTLLSAISAPQLRTLQATVPATFAPQLEVLFPNLDIPGSPELVVFAKEETEMEDLVVAAPQHLQHPRVIWTSFVTIVDFCKLVGSVGAQLLHLNLSRCQLMACEACDKMLEAVAESCPALQTLALPKGKDMGLASMLFCKPTAKPEFTVGALRAFATSLPALRHLQLEGCRGWDNASFEDLVAHHPHLRHLEVDGLERVSELALLALTQLSGGVGGNVFVPRSWVRLSAGGEVKLAWAGWKVVVPEFEVGSRR